MSIRRTISTIASMTEQRRSTRISAAIRDFMRLESAGGLLLLAATVVAMLVANSPLTDLYGELLDTTVAIQVGKLLINKPLLLWVNDGLMAVFFFLVGLEIKREVMEGELSSFSQVILPGMGAIGGMAVPAAIYIWFNWGDSIALDGWAIPVATDIAFALALLGVFGARAPTSLKVFLLTLAIFDDLAAIVIIALFYSSDLSFGALIVGGIALFIAASMNFLGVTRTPSYILLGIVLWIAFCIPLRGTKGKSPLRRLEHDLHRPVAFAILPIFAFVNAGLSLSGISIADLTHPVTSGVILGLLVGKPVGILAFVWLAVILRFAQLPSNFNWMQLLGVAFACGIGFTMSLFIAGLAFEHGSGAYFSGDRLGILVGSILSAIVAYALLFASLPKHVGDG